MTSKKLYPHVYEFERLGGSYTQEGKSYALKNGDALAEEQREEIQILVHRVENLGGSKQIHNDEAD